MKEAGVDSVPRSTWWSRSGVIGLKFVLPEFPQLVLVVLVDHPGGDANSEVSLQSILKKTIFVKYEANDYETCI